MTTFEHSPYLDITFLPCITIENQAWAFGCRLLQILCVQRISRVVEEGEVVDPGVK
jgi:hypothetical protein